MDIKKIKKLTSILNTINQFQREYMFFLTGYYLIDDELQILRPHLTPDNPDIGAEGRFDDVPVFKKLDFISRLTETNWGANYKGILYSFVKMGVVD